MERGSDWPLFLYTGQSFLKFDDGERQSLAALSLHWLLAMRQELWAQNKDTTPWLLEGEWRECVVSDQLLERDQVGL